MPYNQRSQARRCLALLWFSLLALLSANGSWGQQSPQESAQQSPQANTANNKTSADGEIMLTLANGKQSAFLSREKTGTAHGGVLMLPAPGQHPDQLSLIKNLRLQLAEHHWHTLTPFLNINDQSKTGDIINAGIAYFNKMGVYNISILGEGASALDAIDFVARLSASSSAAPAANPSQSSQIKQIRSLILLDTINSATENQRIDAISKIKLPIFDAYTPRDLNATQLAAERRRLAKLGKTPLQQTRLAIIGRHQLHGDNPVSKRLRSWLDNNVAGFMVDRKKR